MNKKVLIIQYGGDYRDTYMGIASGVPEYYANQTYSIEAVKQLKSLCDEITTLCSYSFTAYAETLLEPGVKAIGLGLTSEVDYKTAMRKTIAAIAEYNPTQAILRTPATEILRWLRQKKIPTSLVLADSFSSDSLGKRLKHYMLARELNHPNVKWVGNHGVGSCLSLQNIGVDKQKIIPWDWPSSSDPAELPVKTLAKKTSWRLIYVGAISEAKGVVDCIEAAAILNRSGFSVGLDIFGKGSIDEFKDLAKQRGIAAAINFRGMIPNSQIIDAMHAADVVLVPSRISYPEGFPKTINEALCSKTPLVVSNHPIFVRLLKDEKSAMVFESGSPSHMAEKIRSVLTDTGLYNRLSRSAISTWESLQIPVKWGTLLEKVVSASDKDQQWLHAHRLISGLYKL